MLFVVEHDGRTHTPKSSWPPGQPILQRRLAVADLPTGGVVKSDINLKASWLSGLTGGPDGWADGQKVHSAVLVDVGQHSLPTAPVHGCPEFVPSLYVTPTSITDTMMERLKRMKYQIMNGKIQEKEKPQSQYKLRDAFVFTSNTFRSATVLGVDAQVVAASLDGAGVTGEVSKVHELFNVEAMPDSLTSGLNLRTAETHGHIREEEQLLRLEGCQPIRAAGRKGHMRLEWVFETLLAAFHANNKNGGYTAWLACTTADQKVAIVQSPKRSHWVNFTIPSPIFTQNAISQTVWCPRESEDECFEVWSSPNPNEMAT